MHTLNSCHKNEVVDFIRYKWLMPKEHVDMTKDNVMKDFYSSLYYILENIFEVSQNIEYGIDSIFNVINARVQNQD